jgi:hydrogenase maturation protease
MALVIGYGNPLRGDDGVGQHAAWMLAECANLTHTDVICCHQLTPELAEPISRAALVIFIDATRNEGPGTIRRHRLSPLPGPGAFTHNVSPQALLTSAQALYGNCPAAILYSVGGQYFDYTDTLSAPVRAALPRLLRRVKRHCRRCEQAENPA